MKKNAWIRQGLTAVSALTFAVVTLPASAAPGMPKVAVNVKVEREVVTTDATGKPLVERKPVTAAASGDVLVYTLEAKNDGDGAALHPRLEDPVPAGTVLVLDSVSSATGALAASLDGGSTWQPFPATVVHKTADGSEERVAAPPESYTHLRWVLAGPLGPGESKDVSFKVRVR